MPRGLSRCLTGRIVLRLRLHLHRRNPVRFQVTLGSTTKDAVQRYVHSDADRPGTGGGYREAGQSNESGWVFGFGFDRSGGLEKLAPWDSRDGPFDWRWVHLDSRCPRSKAWISVNCGTRSGQWTAARLLEDDSIARPRASYSDPDAALLLTLQTSLAASVTDATTPFSLCPSIRLWICDRTRIAVSTTCNSQLLSTIVVPAIGVAESVPGRPQDLGEVATVLVDWMIQANTESYSGLESRVFGVKSKLQQAALSAGAAVPVPLAELTELRAQAVPLHYECLVHRRFATPQRDALDELERVSRAPSQPFFSERSLYALREASLQQDKLVMSLDALCSTSQVLSDQLMTHVTWQAALSSHRLAKLGAFLGALGTASVAMDVLSYIREHPAVSDFVSAVSGPG